jgi:hypothetical protein
MAVHSVVTAQAAQRKSESASALAAVAAIHVVGHACLMLALRKAVKQPIAGITGIDPCPPDVGVAR